MSHLQTALIVSPVLAIRQVLAGIARDAGFQTVEIALGPDSLAVLAAQPTAVLLLHHTDVDLVLRLARYGIEQGLRVVALADRQADVPMLRHAGVLALSMRTNWFKAAEMLRAQRRPAA